MESESELALRIEAELRGAGKPRSKDGSGSGGKTNISPSIASKDGRSTLFTKRKILNPLYGPNPYMRSQYAGSYIANSQQARNSVSAFTQRVMSAKLLRVKQLQNQLAETQIRLNEVLNENKTLKTLQHRQDSALKRYEGQTEQLPQLLKSHSEEIRILNDKYKQLRLSYRELENKLKTKDGELTNLREQYKHLLQLSRDRNLGEREKLSKRVEELEAIVEQQKSRILALDKKLSIEEKNHRHQLNQEVNKYKKAQSELNSALETINNLKSALERRDRGNDRYQIHRLHQGAVAAPIHQARPTTSHVSLPPPRVSIRQTGPQRLVRSETSIQQEPQEDSETNDSFTVNYSPGEGGSTSDEYDDLLDGKEANGKTKIQENGLRVTAVIPGSISISKEAFRARRAARRGSEDAKEERRRSLPREPERRQSLTRKENERKKSLTLLQPKIINRERSQEKVQLRRSSKVSLPKEDTKVENKSKDDAKEDKFIVTNIQSNAEPKPEIIVSDMKLDMDDEFEKFLEETKLSDEAINDYFKRDFRTEILEIEQKFEDLNKASDRYLNVKMNGTSEHIESSESETERRRNGEEALLDEGKKADLLKALSDIDGAKEDEETAEFELLEQMCEQIV